MPIRSMYVLEVPMVNKDQRWQAQDKRGSAMLQRLVSNGRIE